MLSKLLLTLAIAGSFSSAFAAEEAKTAEKVKTWKDKLILSYHGEFGLVRQDSNIANRGQYGNAEGDLKDFTHFHNPTLGYKITDTLTLSTSYEFRYADHSGRPKFANRFYRALVSLSKTKILTEQEYGFQLDAGIARRYFDRTAVKATYGNDRVNVTLTKNWGNNNASLFVQYLANDPKDVTSTETWRRGYEIIPTLNLQLTDKLSFTATDDINFNTPWYGSVDYNKEFTMSHEFNFGVFTYKHDDLISAYLQLKYNYSETGFNYDSSSRMTSEDYDYYVGVSYSVTPKITLTGEMGSVLFETHDNKSGFSNKATKPEFTLYVDASF